jgi:hypothetical protein
MPARKSTGPKKVLGAAKKSTKRAGSKKNKSAARGRRSKEELDPAAKRFVRDLLIRGEAARPSTEGDLPPGATHRIVEDGEEGELPRVEREVFSIS